ncbi:MAG: peptide deformylase [Acidobacteriota bacterium]|nr:peptide deformylase [Acidobacteriota bacterium]
MITETVLQVGDPRLRIECATVDNIADPVFQEENRRLHRALAEFRESHGFGRAIAAPQIGIPKRLIAMNLGEGSFSVINPRILELSEETMTLWDDCMSFPWLLVRVRRHRHITVAFQDEKGEHHEWRQMDPTHSELFQHEMDHLDGVLALDRAIDRNALVSRAVFEADPDTFKSQVDFGSVYG